MNRSVGAPPRAVPRRRPRPTPIRPSSTHRRETRTKPRSHLHHDLHQPPQMQRQQSFFPKQSQEHGGALSVKTRRSRRPLATRKALHVTLKSDLATGQRSLKQHKQRIQDLAAKWGKRFGVKTYRFAVCATHLHFLIKGTTREGLQNFFRVFAGHLAQYLLNLAPIKPYEERPLRGCAKNHRKFWSVLTYSRVVTWGREFKRVAIYISKNQLEALHVIAYEARPRPKRKAQTRGP